jgi:hypothetical protein
MKDKIVMTNNLVRGIEFIERLKGKSKRADLLSVLFAKWGFGKTTFIEWLYTNIKIFYVRAMQGWTRSINLMIEDILAAYRVEPRGMLKKDLPELCRVIKKYGDPLIIDEADRVVRRLGLIETIRDVHDICRVPIVLVGGEDIINLLQRRDLGPVFSRVTEICEFQELTVEDIQHIADELCELKCNIKVASFIRTITLGDFRLVNGLLERAEALCALNKLSELNMVVAKEASSIMPRPEDLKRIQESEKSLSEDVIGRAVSVGE